MSILNQLDDGIRNGDRAHSAPDVESFYDYLLHHARCKASGGSVPYSFVGREALVFVAKRIDQVLGSTTGKPLVDATLAICGGAQYGKTIIVLQLIAYLTGIKFRNVGLYLPDEDLVEGVVDGKFRPEILDIHPWFNELLQMGKSVNESGKSVNRKGAFMVSSQEKQALGMMRGLNAKIPTTFTMDVTIQDEKDDIDEKKAKYLSGRTAAGDLRFGISIGTQRYHGLGQNKEFTEGTQEVIVFRNEKTGKLWNLEENWPKVCRMQMGDAPSVQDPCLSAEGDFKRDGESIASYDPSATFYFADPEDGTPLDRSKPEIDMRRPDREKLRRFSIRIPQIACAALSVQQAVSRWQDAVRDPEVMVIFCCEVLANPKNVNQSITPEVITRSRDVDPFDMSLTAEHPVFAGVDTGNRCWFTAIEDESPTRQRMRWAERIAGDHLLARTVALANTLNVSCLFIDAGPLFDTARAVVYDLNGITDESAVSVDKPESAYIRFSSGLIWNGPAGRWENLKAATVEFTQKPGSGIKHKLGKTDDGKLYPVILACRNDTIGNLLNDLLTAQEGVVELIDGKLRTEPKLLLPREKPGAPQAVEDLAQHILTGSKADKDGKFEKDCENHFLLAGSYARLARIVGDRTVSTPFAGSSVKVDRSHGASDFSGRRRSSQLIN